jgi:hypothetical protein
MLSLKNFFASIYDAKLAGCRNTGKPEGEALRSALEKAGFVVTRYEQGAKCEAVKGSVILEVTRLPWGGKSFSIVVGGRHNRRVGHLKTDKLNEAIAFADTAQYLAE